MTNSKEEPKPLWTPVRAGHTPMDKYRRHVNETYSQDLKTSRDLHTWSVQHPQDFWIDLYSWLDLKPPLPRHVTQAYDPNIPMSHNPRWFGGLELNYAENALFANPDDDAVALIGLQEDSNLASDDHEIVTWGQCRERVRLTASALRACGIRKGDRVAALVATSVWAMILYHASASIGAIFTSISPDLGLEGCVSRLEQTTPKIIFADSHTVYKGKKLSTSSKLEKIVRRLSPLPQTYVVPIETNDIKHDTIDRFLEKANPSDKLTFTRVPFNYPLMICYSSGTTGAPKCIVHQHGLIIQLKKIAVVHNSTTPKDVILQYSSTSWVVFYIMCGMFGRLDGF